MPFSQLLQPTVVLHRRPYMHPSIPRLNLLKTNKRAIDATNTFVHILVLPIHRTVNWFLWMKFTPDACFHSICVCYSRWVYALNKPASHYNRCRSTSINVSESLPGCMSLCQCVFLPLFVPCPRTSSSSRYNFLIACLYILHGGLWQKIDRTSVMTIHTMGDLIINFL